MVAEQVDKGAMAENIYDQALGDLNQIQGLISEGGAQDAVTRIIANLQVVYAKQKE